MFGGRRERKMMLRGSAKVVTYAIFRYWKSTVGSSGDQMFISCHSRSQKIILQIFDCDRKCSQELKSFGSDFWEVLKRTPAKLLCASNDGKVEWNTTCCILQNMQWQSWPLIGCIFFKAWDKIQYVIVWYYATQINTIWYNTILYIIFSSVVTVTNTELWLVEYLSVFSDHGHGNILTCCCFPKFLKI